MLTRGDRVEILAAVLCPATHGSKGSVIQVSPTSDLGPPCYVVELDVPVVIPGDHRPWNRITVYDDGVRIINAVERLAELE